MAMEKPLRRFPFRYRIFITCKHWIYTKANLNSALQEPTFAQSTPAFN